MSVTVLFIYVGGKTMRGLFTEVVLYNLVRISAIEIPGGNRSLLIKIIAQQIILGFFKITCWAIIFITSLIQLGKGNKMSMVFVQPLLIYTVMFSNCLFSTNIIYFKAV